MFIVDEVNQELWSRVAKGSTSTIRIPIDKGVVGYVATTGKTARIDEAYLDARFNKEVDKKTNYRTKTILCVPIKDFTGTIIGKKVNLQPFNRINKGYVKGSIS